MTRHLPVSRCRTPALSAGVCRSQRSIPLNPSLKDSVRLIQILRRPSASRIRQSRCGGRPAARSPLPAWRLRRRRGGGRRCPKFTAMSAQVPPASIFLEPRPPSDPGCKSIFTGLFSVATLAADVPSRVAQCHGQRCGMPNPALPSRTQLLWLDDTSGHSRKLFRPPSPGLNWLNSRAGHTLGCSTPSPTPPECIKSR